MMGKIKCASFHLITYNFFLRSTAEFSAGDFVLLSMRREISQFFTEIAFSAYFFVFECNDQKKLKLKPQNSGPCPHSTPNTASVILLKNSKFLIQQIHDMPLYGLNSQKYMAEKRKKCLVLQKQQTSCSEKM